jgi:hypothetical protein
MQSTKKPPINWQEGTWKSQLLLLERNGAAVKEGGRFCASSTDPQLSWSEICRLPDK